MPHLATNVEAPAMVTIPTGWFLMGSDAGQENERPIHRVWVDAFQLAVCQVTNVEYARLPIEHFPPQWNQAGFDHAQQPVVAVSWFEAVAYCAWLSHATGRQFRLPTEGEWEFAARGGQEGKLYPWGDALPESLPDYESRWKTGPERVGRYAANGFGLYDMCDNVHEWCSDWFDPNYYQQSPERNPQGPSEGTRRASRGGSWRHHIKVARCSARSSIPPQLQYTDYGFRVACDL